METKNERDTMQIQRVMSAYCRYVDTKQWEQLRDIITDDASLRFLGVDAQTLHTFTGAAGLIAACKEGISDLATVHHLHNPEINIADDQHASAIWAMEDRFYMTDDAGKSIRVFHGYGHYHVTFINQAGHWKIADLKLTRVRLVQY